MLLQFGVNIPAQWRARPCHCLCLLSIKQTVPYLCLVLTTKQQARLAKQLGYGTRLRLSVVGELVVWLSGNALVVIKNYSSPCPVNAVMGDCLQAGTPYRL